MCGIIGFTGTRHASDIILEGLRCLEYRGYDSAGLTIVENGKLLTIKSKGRLDELAQKVAQASPTGCCGIGHTRWATHGEPSDLNSHPHATDKLSLVHNGIIENYAQLKDRLAKVGYSFSSQTDTESAVKLIDSLYHGDPIDAIQKAVAQIEGSYAFAIVFADHPGEIYGVRKDSPLVAALGKGENFLASDITAVLAHTRRYYLLEENEIVRITKDQITVFDPHGNPISKEVMTADWNVEQAQKGGYPHFMLKEMFEEPKAIRDTVSPRLLTGIPDFSQDGLPDDFFQHFSKINIVACGTAMYAGMVGKNLIDQLARIPVEVDVASEFRYRNPILHSDELLIIISQSGETADSLAALRLAKAQKIPVLSIVNVAGSTIAREADYCIHTFAGPEIAVASTKAYQVQLATFYLIAIRAAYERGALSEEQTRKLCKTLGSIDESVQQMLNGHEQLKMLAQNYVDTHSMFFIGRGLDYALALEGALKLKEISYIHCEAYAAGELKHGTISLITDHVPVVALATQSALLAKTLSNIKEVKSRGADVLLLTKRGMQIDPECFDHLIELPDIGDLFLPMLSVVPLQLLAYYTSVARGCDVDKPRNLAKSVTVE